MGYLLADIPALFVMDSLKQESSLAEFNLPEWETTARYRGEKATKDRRNVKERGLEYFERVMPAHRRYCGLSRNVACIAVLATLVLVIALILGLAIGLSKKSK